MHWSVERLLSEYEAAVTELASGLQITSTGSGDSTASGRTDLTPQQRAELLYAELNIRDGSTYPKNVRADRATARFC